MFTLLPMSGDHHLIESIQAILLAGDREAIGRLTARLEALERQANQELTSLERQLDWVQANAATLQQEVHATKLRLRELQLSLEALQHQARADSEGLVAKLTPVFSDLVGRQIRDNPEEMAEALGPVMGEAMRVQIRESRQDMVDALYPVIGQTVQKAVGEFAREFQRNVDQQLRTTFGPQGVLRGILARLKGVDPAAVAMRDALPFQIRQIFLIQQQSGLLLAHVANADETVDTADSDLISGMLTAIRDFAADSFGQGDEADGDGLSEIQYGTQRVAIQNGRTAYLAVVFTGVEPEGFHGRVREFLSDLHLAHEPVLRAYNGDPALLPNLRPPLGRLQRELRPTEKDAQGRPLGRATKISLWLMGILAMFGIALACFYLQFTIALYPIAFPSPTPTNTPLPTPTATATATPTPTHTPTATPTASPTATPTPTFTPTPSATATPSTTFTPTATPSATPTPTITFTPSATPPPTQTPTPPPAITTRSLWVRAEPREEAELLYAVPAGVPLIVHSTDQYWAEIEWIGQSFGGPRRVWVPLVAIQIFDGR